MNAITIAKLNPATWATLEARARAHAQSVEAEAAAILEDALGGGNPSHADRLRLIDEIVAMTPKGVAQTDSTLLIREDRDR